MAAVQLGQQPVPLAVQLDQAVDRLEVLDHVGERRVFGLRRVRLAVAVAAAAGAGWWPPACPSALGVGRLIAARRRSVPTGQQPQNSQDAGQARPKACSSWFLADEKTGKGQFARSRLRSDAIARQRPNRVKYILI